MRARYLAAVLSQDIPFFDGQPGGALMHALNEDMVALQNAMGEKNGTMLHYLSNFVSGVAVGKLGSACAGLKGASLKTRCGRRVEQCYSTCILGVVMHNLGKEMTACGGLEGTYSKKTPACFPEGASPVQGRWQGSCCCIMLVGSCCCMAVMPAGRTAVLLYIALWHLPARLCRKRSGCQS